MFRFVEALMGPRQYLCCLQPVMGGRIAKFYYQGGALFPAPSGHRDEHYRHVMRETQASVIPCRVFPEEALEHALVLPLSCRSGGRGALVVRCSGDPQESQAGSSSRLGVLVDSLNSYLQSVLAELDAQVLLECCSSAAAKDGVFALLRGDGTEIAWVGSYPKDQALEDVLLTALGQSDATTALTDNASFVNALNQRFFNLEFAVTTVRLNERDACCHRVVVMRRRSSVSQGLSERERQVGVLLAEGYTVVNTAAILNLSESTVRTYVRRLYKKLSVSSRTDLVRQLVSG